MTKLIIYIDSEQKASAYRIEEDNSYSISFNGNEYESDLPTFAELVMDELRATPLSKMESRGGISVLLVSNGAANETIRKIMELLFHDDNEDGMLNVNIQELNVIEAKYFLPLIGNPEAPSAKDFANIYSIETSSFVQQKELDDLKSDNSRMIKKIKEYEDNFGKLNNELSELKEFKKATIKKEENRRSIQKKEEELSESIYKINFAKDAEDSGVAFKFHKKYNNGKIVSKGETIGTYGLFRSSNPFASNAEIGLTAKKSGRIYYMVSDDSVVKNGDIIAAIGEKTWTKEDADSFIKQNQDSDSVKKNENEPVIIKADVIKNYVSETSVESLFHISLIDDITNINDGDKVTKNQNLFTIHGRDNCEFVIKAPCSGKLFILFFRIRNYTYDIVNPETSLAMIVPESWSKSQAVEWYRSIEPLEKPVELCLTNSSRLENLLPDGAWVLPNDKYAKVYHEAGIFNQYYEESSFEGFCKVAGKIKYKDSHKMNDAYYSSGKIAEIN